MSVKPPLGMLHTPRSQSEHDDDEGLLGISLAEGAMELSPTAQVKPKGGVNHFAALRARRRTIDVPAGRQPISPGHNVVRTFPGESGVRPDAVAHTVHVRGGSGGTLSAILGLSAASNRVAPDAWHESLLN
jgi:hypothetical protein